MNRVPKPHADDIVIVLDDPYSAHQFFLCDRDVLPIREQVQKLIDGGEPPLEWVTLSNVDDVLSIYTDLKQYVKERQSYIRMDKPIPLTVNEKITKFRWKLICVVTEAHYGDKKYRAATFHRMPLRALQTIARMNHLKGYSKLRKRDLIYRLVESGLG